MNRLEFLGSLFVSLAVFLGIAFGLSYSLSLPLVSKFSMSWGDVKTGLILGVVLWGAIGAIVSLPWAVCRQLRLEAISLVKLFSGLPFPVLVGVLVLSSFAEEMLFRGVIQVLFVNWIGELGGVLVVGGIITALNFRSLSYSVLILIVSTTLGYVYIWTDNLLAVVATRFVYDLGSISWYLYIEKSALRE